MNKHNAKTQFQLRIEALLCAFTLLSITTLATVTNAAELEHYRWKHRLLIAFVPDKQSAKELDEEHEKGLAALDERDMKVIRAADKSAQSQSLRKRFKVKSNELVFVLVGKDGSEKARQIDKLDLQAMFELIDTMPMRRLEMKSASD